MKDIEYVISQANLGYDESQLQLARYYFEEKKYADAFVWYHKAMKAGNPDGMNGVGICYYKGLGVEQDKSKGEYYLRLGLDNGSTKAMCNLARFIDSSESGALYLSAAKLGDAYAQLKIAYYFMEPQLNSSWNITKIRNTDEAFHWFMKSALQGNRIAQYEVGMFFENGIDPCIRNIEKAFDWYEKSSAQGLKVATFGIGRLYANGIDDQSPDFKSAYLYYKKAADAGLVEAQYRTGLALFYGRGVVENKYKGYEYLLRAAEQGYSDAKFYVALLLATGQGVEQNLQLAKEWLTSKNYYPSVINDYDWKKYELLDYLNKDISEISITECTPIDLAFAKIDSFGVLYSQDNKKLLRYAAEDAYYSSHNVLKQQTLIDYEVPEGVEIICDEAFKECESLERIKLPNSVVHIGESAFSECENLRSVTLPSKITTLRPGTFYGCTSLKELCLPSSLDDIDDTALVGVVGLTSNSKKFIVKDGCLIDQNNDTLIHFISEDRSYFEIPGCVRKIGSYAFSMSTLTSVYIPDTVEEIGENAFECCYFLEEVDFYHHSYSPRLRKIGCGAFGDCENLSIIVLPEGLEIIDTQAFSLCRSLRVIILPKSLQEIGNLAFQGAPLQSITLPKNLKFLGNNAFAGSNLVIMKSESPFFLINELSVFDAEGSKLLQYYGKHEIYRVPDFVHEIGDFAFGYSNTLRCLLIPRNIEKIGKRIIEQTYPKKIVVPKELLLKIQESIDESMYDKIQISDDL